MLAHRPWVAFEVDEVVGPFQWRSVVVHGSFNVLADEGGPTDRATYARALRALSRIMPGAFSGGDPVPERTVLFGIAVHEITGRMASPDSR